MKRIFLFLLLGIAVNAGAQTITPLDSSVWSTNYTAALQLAKDSGRPLLMVFSGSDWCKPCIKLREQILVKPEFSTWAQSQVVCVCLDFPSQKKNALPEELKKQNEALAEKFNTAGTFPLVVIIDGNENMLGTAGYLDVTVAEYVVELEKFLKTK